MSYENQQKYHNNAEKVFKNNSLKIPKFIHIIFRTIEESLLNRRNKEMCFYIQLQFCLFN